MALWNKSTPEPIQPTRAASVQSLEDLEAIISTGLTSFAQVGKALATIKTKRLYAEQYPSWEAYLDQRWKLTDDYATRLSIASEVCLNVKRAGLPEPVRASHARTLSKLPKEQQVDAWQETLTAAGNDPEAITAELVESTIAKRRKKKARRKAPKAITLRGKGWAITITRKSVDVSIVEALAAALNQAQAMTDKKAA